MYKYFLLNNISEKGIGLFGSDFSECDDISHADLAIVRSAKMHDIDTHNLLAIARAGAGTNNIPKDRCASEGVVVFNTPGANANAVKELMLLGMLMASRDVVSGINWVKTLNGEEEIASKIEKGKSQFNGSELLGKKAAIIGMGEIGSILANTLNAMGMEISCYSPSFAKGKKPKKLKIYLEPEESALSTVEDADYILLALPLNSDTEKMINRDFFSMMRKGSVLLNFSRAGLVDEDALEEALNSDILRKYVTDFTTQRVLSMKNTICLPHMGASTKEATDNCAEMAVTQIKDYVINGNIKNSVNYPDIDMGQKQETRLSVLFEDSKDCSYHIEKLLSEGGVEVISLNSVVKNGRGAMLMDVHGINESIAAKISQMDAVRKVRLL